MISIHAFQEIRAAIHSGTSVNEVLETLAKTAAKVVDGQGAIVRILKPGSQELGSSAAYGVGEKYLSRGFLSRLKTITDLYQLNRIVVIDDLLNDHRVQHGQEVWEDGIRMIVDVPLGLEEQIAGIIRVYLNESREFSKEELNFLVTCAICGTCAIEKAQILEAQKSQYDHLALQTEKLSALGRMAAGIAHEINNPLAGILLYSTNLMKKIPETGPLKEGLEIIVSETTRCGKIIQELLDFSRGGEPNKALANMNDIIEKSLSILENEFRLHHIEVDKQLSDEMADIFVDANQMEQVLVNLLLNAIEAIQEQGVITVRTRMEPNRNCETVEIADTGCGIPPEHMSILFEPFFSSKKNGTGLGLAVSYGIVQKHQGTIRVSSQPGQGTCFSIELPLLKSASSRGTEGHEHGTDSYTGDR